MQSPSLMRAAVAALSMQGFFGAQRADSMHLQAQADLAFIESAKRFVDVGSHSHAKPGKHRSGGKTSPRPNYTTDWRGEPGHRENARRLRAHWSFTINRHFHERMAWNEDVYPRVLELQRKQRERSR